MLYLFVFIFILSFIVLIRCSDHESENLVDKKSNESKITAQTENFLEQENSFNALQCLLYDIPCPNVKKIQETAEVISEPFIAFFKFLLSLNTVEKIFLDNISNDRLFEIKIKDTIKNMHINEKIDDELAEIIHIFNPEKYNSYLKSSTCFLESFRILIVNISSKYSLIDLKNYDIKNIGNSFFYKLFCFDIYIIENKKNKRIQNKITIDFGDQEFIALNDNKFNIDVSKKYEEENNVQLLHCEIWRYPPFFLYDSKNDLIFLKSLIFNDSNITFNFDEQKYKLIGIFVYKKIMKDFLFFRIENNHLYSFEDYFTLQNGININSFILNNERDKDQKITYILSLIN